ncbi:hypothetical protein [uncultured Leifsonia sp.]|uniref:hypothetical protein n=1 Tax=uncultured Leifsonia sp. TaxID=340359 RepID=UPI0028D17FB0|nr:hypothetical protein [uncultured Leifsonia sp.]
MLRQTGVLVSVPAGARGATPRPASAETAAITTATVQGELDDDVNFGGSYLTITNANFCDGSTVYQIGNLATLGFNDKTSSFIGYANCTMKIWENAGFTGASLGYVASSANVGPAMNDRASSVQLR